MVSQRISFLSVHTILAAATCHSFGRKPLRSVKEPPALLLAGRAAFVDLDGPLWLSHDRDGGVTDRDGILHPPAAGLWGAAA